MPSEEDKEVTRQLMECGRILDIRMLNHVIIAGETGEIFSFKNSDLLYQKDHIGQNR